MLLNEEKGKYNQEFTLYVDIDNYLADYDDGLISKEELVNIEETIDDVLCDYLNRYTSIEDYVDNSEFDDEFWVQFTCSGDYSSNYTPATRYEPDYVDDHYDSIKGLEPEKILNYLKSKLPKDIADNIGGVRIEEEDIDYIPYTNDDFYEEYVY